MKVLGTLEGETTDTGYVGSIGVVEFSNGIRLDDRITMTKGQAFGLLSILNLYFNGEPALVQREADGGVAKPTAEQLAYIASTPLQPSSVRRVAVPKPAAKPPVFPENDPLHGAPYVDLPDVHVPAEDTVALLCRAAKRWAKWDARFQAAMCEGVPMTETLDGLMAKVHKWRTRTLSYGHHLLSAGVPEEDPCTESAPRLFDPYAELARLDTLVQQLCARVSLLEGDGPV